MAVKPLTNRQAEILAWIKAQCAANGYGPSLRQIGDQFGIASPHGVLCNVEALERKGALTRPIENKRHIARVFKFPEE